MLLNYLKLSFRLLLRNPFFTSINVLGLSVGFSAFFILWQHSQNQLMSDRFHKDYDRIYRPSLYQNFSDGGSLQIVASNPEVLRTNLFPEVEEFTRIINQGSFYGLPHDNQVFIFYTNEKNERSSIEEEKLAYADANLFTFFTIPLVQGDPKSVLKKENTVVISRSTSKKYFGTDEASGKILYLNDSIPLTVTGVFEDLPRNTHLMFEMVISISTLEKDNTIDTWNHASGYVKIREGASVAKFEKNLDLFLKKNFKEWMEGFFYPGIVEQHFFAQPLQEIPFELYDKDHHVRKEKNLLIVLGVAAVVILLMAWINYINLTLSFNQRRMKELAARKAVGAQTVDLIKQFVVEAMLVNMIALLAALTIVQVVRYPIQVFFEFNIPLWKDVSLLTWGIIVVTFALGLLVTGLYPSLLTIGSSPKSLFGTPLSRVPGSRLSYWLTALQYGASIVLITWACTVYLQLRFILNKDVGINKADVVIVDLPDQPASKLPEVDRFVHRVSRFSAVTDYASSGSVTGDADLNWVILQRENVDIYWPDSNGGVDERFIPFFGIKLIAGRNFLPNNPADAKAIILSRMSAFRLGFQKPEDALGHEVFAENNKGEFGKVTVIGVIEDYYMSPSFVRKAHSTYGIHHGIALVSKNSQVGLFMPPRKMSLRITPEHFDETISQIGKEFSETFPHAVFNWYFLDDHITQHYESEKTARNQIGLFTLLAIGIACLGLLGVITCKIAERTKEIGIRKILGARLHQLALVLLNTTIRQIVFSILVGIPVAWYLTEQFLYKYYDRITLHWWHFALPVALLLFIMLSTIASVVLKAAKTNPVESLRYE